MFHKMVGRGTRWRTAFLLIANRKIKAVMKRGEVLAHQRPARYVKFAIAFLLQPCLFPLIVSSYPHSMAPRRWFSNRKDCIWKHKPTIYTPNKQWDVNLNTLNSLQSSPFFYLLFFLLTLSQHPSFPWYSTERLTHLLGRLQLQTGFFHTVC